ncbi:MAG TPA: YeaH/YhbH family protein [Candidatus Sulfotelmatobacter sp.]|nr:YeaH/YhbH family protein [Candidatus Sulfotelmatobacter sp.]
MNIVDRRLNPKGKSLGNRQRFLTRARAEVKGAVQEATRKRKVGDLEGAEKISIPTKGIAEPNFRYARGTGKREIVVPGNKEFITGDKIPRPPGGEGEGGRGEASPDGEGEDAFEFVLSKDEFLDLFFDDLELPDLIGKQLKDATSMKLARAGYTVSGTPSNLNVGRTMRNSMARRISLNRPRRADVEALEREVADAEAAGDEVGAARARKALDALLRRVKLIPYVDPVDVRYNRFEKVPKPNTQAVMFCLMDVSGSMSERMKDLAKRFFMLLHVFLGRRYRQVDVVFIRHTSVAKEVDEDTFFYSTETGGTVVSTALEEMLRVVRDRYPLEAWNIYAAQASDGDNIDSDSGRCISLLKEQILPITQYFAYVEVGAGSAGLYGSARPESVLWTSYNELSASHPNFAIMRVDDPAQIFPVFHELFAKDRRRA